MQLAPLATTKKYLPDESVMTAMGALLASALLDQGLLIFLQGELGAGKTTLVRGFLHSLGYKGRVKSPTYTLVESYQIATQTLYHFDFYRIADARELEFIGLQDYLHQDAICLIEWPELAGDVLPTPDLVLRIAVQDSGRSLEIMAVSQRGLAMVEKIQHELQTL